MCIVDNNESLHFFAFALKKKEWEEKLKLDAWCHGARKIKPQMHEFMGGSVQAQSAECHESKSNQHIVVFVVAGSRGRVRLNSFRFGAYVNL